MNRAETITVVKDDAGIRLDKWFKKHRPGVPFGHLSKLFRTGQVRLNGKRCKGNDRTAEGDEIRIPPMEQGQAPRKPAKPRLNARDAAEIRSMVIYEDRDLIVLNKPEGLAVQGGSGQTRYIDAMLPALKSRKDRDNPKLVHRLDKDTSGVLVVARNSKAARFLTKAFREKDCHKIYWALLKGMPEIPEGKIDAPLEKGNKGSKEKMLIEDDGKRSITYYKVIDHAANVVSWAALVPLTGRTHQLRAHMAHIDTPIVGDGKYGGREAHLEGLSGKLHLHAKALSFPHPAGGIRQVEAPLPEHMAKSFKFFGFEENEIKDPFEGMEV